MATSRSEALCIFRLTFKSLGYKLRGVFDTSMGSLHRLRDGPLHHRLKGDLGSRLRKQVITYSATAFTGRGPLPQAA
jgi:hypothetical protein